MMNIQLDSMFSRVSDVGLMGDNGIIVCLKVPLDVRFVSSSITYCVRIPGHNFYRPIVSPFATQIGLVIVSRGTPRERP